MELDERKIKILNTIIQTYLDTGEPVGSRTISRYSDLKLSSATIRNEMSDLEEMGYIFQPHTSAGRIPTDKGYRFYVDNMLRTKTEQADKERAVVVQKVDRLEQVLKQVVRLLAANTNYASMITTPRDQKNKLKFIQLSAVEECKVLSVMMLEGNLVKHRVLTTEEPISQEDIVKLNLLLNTYLQGRTLQDISMELVQDLKDQAGEHRKTISDLIDAIVEAIREEDGTKVFRSGTTNLLKYPELGDREKTGELLTALEENQGLEELIDGAEKSDDKGIQVYIGSEMPVASMQDCSMVTATYELDEGVRGTIGIIGPKRMDYKKVVNNLETVMTQLDGIFHPDRQEPDDTGSDGADHD